MTAVTDPVGRGAQAASFVRGALRSNSRSWVVRVGRVLLLLPFLVGLLAFLLNRLR